MVTWYLVICVIYSGGPPGGCASVPMQSLEACLVAVSSGLSGYRSCINTETGEIRR